MAPQLMGGKAVGELEGCVERAAASDATLVTGEVVPVIGIVGTPRET